MLSAAGIDGVTSHAFRRTVATVLDGAGGADVDAEMLEHTWSAKPAGAGQPGCRPTANLDTPRRLARLD